MEKHEKDIKSAIEDLRKVQSALEVPPDDGGPETIRLAKLENGCLAAFANWAQASAQKIMYSNMKRLKDISSNIHAETILKSFGMAPGD